MVFGEERYPAYDRVHLSEYFAGRSAESLSLAAGDFFIEHGIELRLGEAVASIDRDARLVRDAEGHEIHWDKLVLATGSYPFVPPIPGNDLAGCFVYRTLDDLDRIAAHAAAAKSGVVIGGGLLGLEAANALQNLPYDIKWAEFPAAAPLAAALNAGAVDAGIIGYYMAKRGQNFDDGDGIVTAGIEATIRNVGRLAKEGMKETNDEIISIMIGS